MLSWCLQSHLNGVCGSIHRIRNRLPTEFKWVSCLFSWCNIWDTKTSPLCITTVSFCVTWWQWKCVESYFHHKSFWNCDIPETSWVSWCLGGKIKAWKKSRGSTDNFWRGTCCKKKTNKQTSIAAIAGSHICHICQLSWIMRESPGYSFCVTCSKIPKSSGFLCLYYSFWLHFLMWCTLFIADKKKSFFLVTPI